MPKNAQTALILSVYILFFDVLSRLAEDGVNEADDREIYVAVLGFGLKHVRTCDLLALFEEQVKLLELLNPPSRQYQEIEALLRKIYPQDHILLHSFIVRVSDSDQDLYDVVGLAPLIKLLANEGAPHCEQYAQQYLNARKAGKYFMSFVLPENSEELKALVNSLPDVCKSNSGLVGLIGGLAYRTATNPNTTIGTLGHILAGDTNKRKFEEAIDKADSLLSANDVLPVLRSVPLALPRPLIDVVRLVKRLRTCKNSVYDPKSKSTVFDWEDLLNKIEPYLYGETPLCQALRSLKSILIASGSTYSQKTMVFISDGDSTDGDPRDLATELRQAGATIFACLITETTIKQPRKLYGSGEDSSSWSDTVRTMFDMASTVSWDSRSVQALRRRGWALPNSGSCKLFVQANNAEIIDEFTTAARELGTSSDALAEVMGQIPLDEYIENTNADVEATDQRQRPICWAHATATVVHLASIRIVGRKVKHFFEIRKELFDAFGKNAGQFIPPVLDNICPKYRLQYKERNEAGARAAIHARRPVIAAFYLEGEGWDNFGDFYRDTPKDILTSQDLSKKPTPRPEPSEYGGHAVVLVRCDETSLTFMNSWGSDWANNGFFTIDCASTLAPRNGLKMKFFDVYLTLENVTDEEKAYWELHKKETGSKVLGVLPKSFHDLPVICPLCKASAKASEYDGA